MSLRFTSFLVNLAATPVFIFGIYINNSWPITLLNSALLILIWSFWVRNSYRSYRSRIDLLGGDQDGPVWHAWIYQRNTAMCGFFISVQNYSTEELEKIRIQSPKDYRKLEQAKLQFPTPMIFINFWNLGHFDEDEHAFSLKGAIIWLSMVELHELAHWAGHGHPDDLKDKIGIYDKEKLSEIQHDYSARWNKSLLKLIRHG